MAKEHAWIFAQDRKRTLICRTSKRIPLLQRGASLSPVGGQKKCYVLTFSITSIKSIFLRVTLTIDLSSTDVSALTLSRGVVIHGIHANPSNL